ncbi:Uncharacterized protein dnl_52710 [Desulfonema limicola]|uniref:Uncharacterized protein n=1 Tax=Desulfonema limicola TaxID=45656 RepID=A0A975BCX3_9BACT|nr:hypothetical protein [Desulfonema limicola]QTA82885.1 Uncharacterized protein dnl_52710 [Desulfonema limicola]
MNTYQKEQFETLNLVRNYMAEHLAVERTKLVSMIKDYLCFRDDTSDFLFTYFGNICTRNCYENKLSACCSKDGIITFFADHVINALVSEISELDAMAAAVQNPAHDFKCIYLGKNGCVWKIKPIVCEMFLCSNAENEVFKKNPESKKAWTDLEARKKRYTWPDRPVLFDALEQYFIASGFKSDLMYMNNSPGLLRLKQNSIKKGHYI